MPELSNVLLLYDQNLDVRLCTRFVWDDKSGRITHFEFADDNDYNLKFNSAQTNRVLIPAFVNGHTHIGDSCLADGATGLTLEQGFFRPNGFKYIELAKHSEQQLVDAMRDTMNYMLSTGTIMHWDFREQGVNGLHQIREAEKQAYGLKSIVLSQFDRIPFEEGVNRNQDLPNEWKFELENLWNNNAGDIADGFSESTMNDLTDRAWATIRDMSRKYKNKLRAIHCLENDTYRSVSMALTDGRQSDLQRAFELYDPDIVVHLTEATQEDIDVIIQEQNKTDRYRPRTFVVCPRANATLGLKLPPIHALLANGINLMLGTDNVMLNQPNMLAEMDFTYRLCKSQSGDQTHDPKEILRMATTINSYPTIYGKNEKGGIYKNGPADFVMLDFSAAHLIRTKNLIATIVSRLDPRQILATVHHGYVVWDKNMFHGPIPAERYYPYLTWHDVDMMPNKANVILIQPIGAIEQHGAHLPLITDDAIGLEVIGKTLEQFPQNGNPIVYVLPPQHSGRSTEHISFSGTISLSATTLTNVLMDIAASVYQSGFRKLVFFNSHGGQPQVIEIVARDLRQRYVDFLIFPIFIWHLPNVGQTLVTPHEFKYGIHAGDMETSLMLTILGKSVRMHLAEKEYPSTVMTGRNLLGIEGGLAYAWITKDLSQSGVIGDPTGATQEKGEQILASLVASFKKLLEEIDVFHF